MKKRLIQFSLLLCLMALMCVTAGATGATTPDSGFRNVSVETAYASSVTLKPLTSDGAEVTEADGDFPGALKMGLVYQNPQAGSEYLLFVLSGDETVPSVDNMAYIDQKSASASTVEYVIYPKKIPAGTTSVTYSVYMASNASVDSSGAASGQVTEYVKVASFEYYSASSVLLGDVNNDGDIGVGDATMILEHTVHLRTLTDRDALAADVNKDSDIGVGDATMILEYAVHLRTSLE